MRERVRDIERLRHINECIGDDTVSPQFVWETYTNDLVYLKERVEICIKELDE